MKYSRFRILFQFVMIVALMGCNKEEAKFSAAQIQQALFDLKGTYHGSVRVSYYQGEEIAEVTDAVAVSRDSLSFSMSLLPLAELVSDQNVAEYMREVGEVQVTAGYDFTQMDAGAIHFGLHPKEIVILGGCGAPPTIRIVLSQNFGGDADVNQNFMMFNLSPVEMWINGEKQENFRQLVLHFSGTYE